MKIDESKTSYRISYATECNTSAGGDETALIVDGGYFILNGDWVDEYSACKNKKEQRELFRKNYEDKGGFWTDDVDNLKK